MLGVIWLNRLKNRELYGLYYVTGKIKLINYVVN